MGGEGGREAVAALKEIEESTMADGCSRLQILVRVILPLSVPGLLSAGIFCVTLCWTSSSMP